MYLVEIYLRALLNIYYMSEYTKPCIFCKAEIRMSNKNEGKWLPYNLDGSAHDCKASDQKSTDIQNHNTGAIRIERKKPLPWRKGFQD